MSKIIEIETLILNKTHLAYIKNSNKAQPRPYIGMKSEIISQMT